MKYNPWPTKKEASPIVMSKESTPKKSGDDHKEQEMCQPIAGEGPMEKNQEAPPSPEVKRRKTGNTKAYLA
jgi:hypothetical protein